ncbi:hypothetical protein [Sporosarcina psychrophila]|uniref:hypothetical protein n=1 Tax=Sporosarcina TaxID=1569 RepID=UPI00078C17EF|nr:hypothetical protein [Sporosarcina psychrophila]AMQ05199.1 hypothetical protein AZE41_04170 [Sporosarcina psychrophila]
MKNISKCIFIICLMLMLVSCENSSGLIFKGEGVNWSGELITEYSFWGKEIQSIRITYKGENPEQLSTPNFNVESTDFLGWGIGDIKLDGKGIYYSGDVIELETKTPSSSKIILTLEGEEFETITLSSSS